MDKEQAELMLTEAEPDIKLTFDEKLRKHTWAYFPKKNWNEPPEMEEIVKFGDGYVEPEVEPGQSPKVEPQIHELKSENEDSVPPIISKPTKTKSILKKSRPGPSGLGRKRKRN